MVDSEVLFALLLSLTVNVTEDPKSIVAELAEIVIEVVWVEEPPDPEPEPPPSSEPPQENNVTATNDKNKGLNKIFIFGVIFVINK